MHKEPDADEFRTFGPPISGLRTHRAKGESCDCAGDVFQLGLIIMLKSVHIPLV